MWELILRSAITMPGPAWPSAIPSLPGEVTPRPREQGFIAIAFRESTKYGAATKANNAVLSLYSSGWQLQAGTPFTCLAIAASRALQESAPGRIRVPSRDGRAIFGVPMIPALPYGCEYEWRYVSPTMRTTPARAAFNFPFLMGTPRIGGFFGPRQKLVPTAVGRAMNRLRAPKVMTGFQTGGCCGGTVAGCGGPACGGVGCKPAVGCKQQPTTVGACLQYVYTDLAGSGCGYSTPCDIGCGIGC